MPASMSGMNENQTPRRPSLLRRCTPILHTAAPALLRAVARAGMRRLAEPVTSALADYLKDLFGW